jgi:hypothetical protein
MVSNLVLLVCALPLGFLAGSKVAVGLCLLSGAVGMVFFLWRWTGDERAAWLGAALFLLSPSLLTRAVGFEHFVVVASLALLPWVLWSLVGMMREGTARSAVVFGFCFSALALAYAKTALMAVPALIAFAAFEYFSLNRLARPAWTVMMLAGGCVVFLAVIPNLPALRELDFVAMFHFGPFEGWQRAFSTKSALSWLDRDGILGGGMDSGFAPTTLNGGTYLGVAGAIVLATALLRGSLHAGANGRSARLMLALAMGMFWLSFGPRSVLGGHFEFLRMSAGAADFTPAIAWFLLAAQVWVIFQLLPQGSARWQWVATGLSLIYLFVPGFRLLELLPLYQNIRAPFDFYQVTGTVFLVAAVSVSAGVFMAEMRHRWQRLAFVAALTVLAAADVSPYAKAFFTERMDRQVWNDFLEVQDFLKTAPEPGRVHPFSGRYFYLMTPWLSGRPLTSEAFNSYLQQRSAAALQGSAFLNDTQTAAYLRAAGVAYVLIDKSDPDTSQKLQEKFREMLPVVFENSSMALLGVKKPLGYAFLARDFVKTDSIGIETAIAALGGAEHNLAMIQLDGGPTTEPGLQGNIVNGRIASLDGNVMQEGRDFLPVKRSDGATYQRVSFDPTGHAGWLVFNEAWHPDWRALEDGIEIPVRQALLGFSAVKTSGEAGVVFEFRQPWWYNYCAWTAVISWAGAVVFLVFFRKARPVG